ncbi:hypothetical protein [Spirosoma agri]|uniref:Uncharacterized protein n=1 Tax=Spirosoma agri TaxID=1987381 RepID=A0A6M0ILY8_9BACT|nr:hypothetical protein [Spirosoma agri]NEU68887.1 hypothetical protein [Spirosoma agri]
MKQHADTLTNELETFRTNVKALILRLYRANVKNHVGEVMPEVYLSEEWEYEGQVFNALTERGLAYIVKEELIEEFTWNDLDIESLVEIVTILEDKEFD